jgi:hypothetical protein
MFDGSVDRLEDNIKAGPSKSPRRGDFAAAQCPVVENTFDVWNYTKDEMEDIEFGVVLQYRPSP